MMNGFLASLTTVSNSSLMPCSHAKRAARMKLIDSSLEVRETHKLVSDLPLVMLMAAFRSNNRNVMLATISFNPCSFKNSSTRPVKSAVPLVPNFLVRNDSQAI